ncbi:MAG TPA: CapA family protein [Neobacillus sp.]|jgi:poly-gamma-glutamate synthesis protein (capsule biosynthesis protein)
MKKKAIIPLILLIFVCIATAYYLIRQQQKDTADQEKIKSAKVHSTRPTVPIGREMSEKITVGAIGDILMHDTVYKDAYNGVKYNFDPIFQNVNGLLEKPDILTANQESMLGGIELGVSSYPSFNSPHEVADALVHTGVDIVSTANNHTLDKGERGIDSEAHYLDSIGLPHVGSFLNEQDRLKLRIIEKNGIKLAFLSYSYGTNGIPVPAGKDFLVNIINRDSMKEEIHRARQEADVVVMSIHWGNEYQRIPTADQKDLATFLANEGVDIIFGSHPHVLQPMEWIKTNDGRKTFVVYSLGNFISGQIKDYKDIGGLATVDITKHVSEKGNSIELSNPVFYPTFVSSQNFKNYRVVPLEKAGAFGLANADAKYNEIQDHMLQWLR